MILFAQPFRIRLTFSFVDLFYCYGLNLISECRGAPHFECFIMTFFFRLNPLSHFSCSRRIDSFCFIIVCFVFYIFLQDFCIFPLFFFVFKRNWSWGAFTCCSHVFEHFLYKLHVYWSMICFTIWPLSRTKNIFRSLICLEGQV